MSPIDAPNLIKRAMTTKRMNQQKFSREIGKSQAQLSKYITGKTEIPSSILIHCMNIIQERNAGEASAEGLLYEVVMLDGDTHQEIRDALMKMIIAYKGRDGTREDAAGLTYRAQRT